MGNVGDSLAFNSDLSYKEAFIFEIFSSISTKPEMSSDCFERLYGLGVKMESPNWNPTTECGEIVSITLTILWYLCKKTEVAGEWMETFETTLVVLFAVGQKNSTLFLPKGRRDGMKHNWYSLAVLMADSSRSLRFMVQSQTTAFAHVFEAESSGELNNCRECIGFGPRERSCNLHSSWKVLRNLHLQEILWKRILWICYFHSSWLIGFDELSE